MSEGQKEKYLSKLFNKCMQLMDAHYRKTHVHLSHYRS